MPESSQSDLESMRDSLPVIIIDGEECYGERPGGLPCPETDQLVEFDAFIKDGVRIERHFFARPVLDSVDNTNYGIVGPDDPDTN